jgi:hypothetical protein
MATAKHGNEIHPEAYLRECELKDVTDEIRRRVRYRGKQRTAAGATP